MSHSKTIALIALPACVAAVLSVKRHKNKVARARKKNDNLKNHLISEFQKVQHDLITCYHLTAEQLAGYWLSQGNKSIEGIDILMNDIEIWFNADYCSTVKDLIVMANKK